MTKLYQIHDYLLITNITTMSLLFSYKYVI